MQNTGSAYGFWKTAFIYGGSAGALVILMMLSVFYTFGINTSTGGIIFAFGSILFILSLLFFGMRRFRNVDQAGEIKISKAILLGLAMSLIAGAAYVAVTEIYTAFAGDYFIDSYMAALIEQQKTNGVSGEALAEFTAKMEALKANHAKASYRIPATFMELFPMALIVSLVSALVLHRPKFWARQG